MVYSFLLPKRLPWNVPGAHLEGDSLKKDITDLCPTPKAAGKLARSPRTFVLQVWSRGSCRSGEEAAECHEAPAEGNIFFGGCSGHGLCLKQAPQP